MTDYVDVPKSSTKTDTVLAYSVSIASKATHTYTIEIKYINDENASQNIDMNSTLSGNIYIGVGTTPPTLAEAMLRDNPIVSERTDFSVANTSDTTGTIYKTNKTEDGSEVYYYSGNTTNNWVKFGKGGKCMYEGMEALYYDIVTDVLRSALNSNECTSANVCNIDNNYGIIGVDSELCEYIDGIYLNEKATWNDEDIYWRIIRTNEDGSVRLLYSGTSHDTTRGNIGNFLFNNPYGDSAAESRYMGYMYGENTSLADNRANTYDSEIKEVIDTWYQDNLLESYDKYISKSAIYCNDRSISDGTLENSGGSDFYYGAYTRLVTNNAPNYKCGANISDGLFESTQAVEDKFSVSTAGGGNGQLTYPIALMTADEVAFAGSTYYPKFSINAWFALNSNGNSVSSSWWTMTPTQNRKHFTVYGNGEIVSFESINEGGLYQKDWSIPDYSVRPVISIDSCAKFTGTGTVLDPYVIDVTSSTCS